MLAHQLHFVGISRSTELLRQRNPLTLAILLWLAAVALVWWSFLGFDYSGSAAPLNPVSAAWPANTGLTVVRDRPTVLFFMHPKCPCTRASVAELERLWMLRDDRNLQRSPRLVVVATVP